MPTIPSLIQDTQQLQTDTGRQRIRYDAGAYGAQEAQALGAVADGLRVGASVAAEQDDELIRARVAEADNELATRIRERMLNIEDGYLSTQRGANALSARDQVEADIDAMAVEIGQRFRDPRAAARYRAVAAERVSSSLGDIAQHAANESRVFDNEQSEGRINNFMDNAVAAYGDEAAVQAQVTGAMAELDVMRQRNGWGEDIYRSRQRQLQSGMLQRVIVSLATTDPEAAQDLYDRLRPGLDAQTAGELLTTMQAAQRDHVERIEGMGWQAIANGRPLNSIDPEAYEELTTNPLLGAAHMRLRQAQLAMTNRSGSGGADATSSAYITALFTSETDPRLFSEPGALEAYIAQYAGELTRADINALFERRRAISGGQPSEDASAQASAYSAVRQIAAATLGAYGLDLSPRATDSDGQRTARAFDAALQREVSRYLRENGGRQPQGEDVQMVIGRAVVGMSDPNLRRLPSFRVRGDRSRTRPTLAGRGPRVAAPSEGVVPFDLIPEIMRNQLIVTLRGRLGRNVSRGEVENAYAAYLQGRSLDSVIVGAGQ